MTTRPRAVLIGPPGSGKTTVGALVADALGTTLTDTDTVVEEAAGRSVADIFVGEGEAAFRDLERAAVAGALAGTDGVVALGGGAPMEPGTAAALEGHTVVFLDVGIADAAGRVGFDRSRPLLLVNPRARWVALMADRRATYERLATFRVDTAGRTPAEVAAEVVALLPGAAP
ncbi:MAG TPA: shikimate kinase [Dermatophilaceae bacterium]|nr:shikimate kinase [Dermatophilaceae bacterium]